MKRRPALLALMAATALTLVHGPALADGTHIGCGTLINAAGSGATALAHSAGIELPVQPRKRCVFPFHSPEPAPRCPLVIDTQGVYFRPEGTGFLCGVALPEGLKEHDRLPTPIITPAAKAAEGHDEDISREEILAQGIVSEKDYKTLER